ncbi:MAG: ribokinase [Inquilinaceae bacterium]
MTAPPPGGGRIAILGVFVADLSFRAGRLPAMGETVMGTGFTLGPGGKGSNQAVAAKRAGAEVAFITKLGDDPFGDLARRTYAAEGIDPTFVSTSPDLPTGAAFILVTPDTGENAIVVAAGAVEGLRVEEIDAAAPSIAAADVFLTQLELPVPLAAHGLALARAKGVPTILNPAPAVPLPDAVYPLVDYFTPNETEAAMLSGRPVETRAQAEDAADIFLQRGVGTVLVTLGAEGVLLKDRSGVQHVPSFRAGTVVDTTGAGDAFNGGFAVGLARGLAPAEAARFGCAVAGLSVTRHGTAPSMPRRDEIEALLRGTAAT